MNQRSVDRKLLASFIEYAVKGVVTPSEWQRFMVAHYPDAEMERARSECVRIFIASTHASKIGIKDREYLFQLASQLRSTI
jgi:hypothetical protein